MPACSANARRMRRAVTSSFSAKRSTASFEPPSRTACRPRRCRFDRLSAAVHVPRVEAARVERAPRLDRAGLLRRTFALYVFLCTRCGAAISPRLYGDFATPRNNVRGSLHATNARKCSIVLSHPNCGRIGVPAGRDKMEKPRLFLLVIAVLVWTSTGCSGSDGPSDSGIDSGPTVADAGGDGGEQDAGHLLSQGDYTYPGCTHSDMGCPRMPTLYCALEKIIGANSSCDQDTDCEFATIDSRCSGFPRCPGPAVRKDNLAAFETEFQAEIDRYCNADGGCVASEGSCQYPVSAVRPGCVSGKCRSVLLDGGM